jgi:hypothetical protein
LLLFNMSCGLSNVVIAAKGVQNRNINLLAGTTVKNKGKLILTEIFPSVQKYIFSINVIMAGIINTSAFHRL